MLINRLLPQVMFNGSTKTGAGQVGTLDSMIFSHSLTKLRTVPYNCPEDLTRSSNIKSVSSNLDDETRKCMSNMFRSCIPGEKTRLPNDQKN